MVNQRVSGFYCSIYTKMEGEHFGALHVPFSGGGQVGGALLTSHTHAHAQPQSWRSLQWFDLNVLRFQKSSGEFFKKAFRKTKHNFIWNTPTRVHTYTQKPTDTHHNQELHTLVCFLILHVVMWEIFFVTFHWGWKDTNRQCFLFFFQCILWSTCDRPPGKMWVK